MKLQYHLHFIFALLLFSSCVSTNEKNQSVVIKGQLYTDTIPVLYLFENKALRESILVDSVSLESKAFTLSNDNLHEGYYTVKSTNTDERNPAINAHLYLVPGDTIFIIQTRNELNYKGAMAHLQEYDARAWEYISVDSLYEVVYSPSYELAKRERAEAQSVIEEIRDKKLNFFEAYFNGQVLPEKFERIERTNIDMDAARKYYRYLRYHKYMTADTMTLDYLEVDNSFYRFLDRMDLNADYNYMSFLYPWLLDDHINDVFYRAYDIYDGDSRKIYDLEGNQSEFKFKAQWVKDNLTGVNRDVGFYSILSSIRMKTAIYDSLEIFYEDLRDIHAFIKDNHTDSTIIAKSIKICEDYFKIAPGTKAPELTLPDRNGEMVSLQDFESKLVYIDFWGTWCGPCIASIPDHRELQKSYVGKDIVFLNVAMEAGDKEIEGWKKFLDENDFPGVHVVARGQFRNEKIQPFMISAAPTYLLIDREGKIVSANAPSPSSAGELIDEILGKG